MPISPPPTRTRRPRHAGGARLRGLVTAAAGLLTAGVLLTGCGSASHHAQVASLASHGSGSSHHSASATSVANAGIPDPDGRPRQPLNATDAQISALYDPYYACLRAHSYIDQHGAKAQLSVVAKCERLSPLPPWQFDPTNPQARSFIGSVVSCLIAKGYDARADLQSTPNFVAPQWQVSYSSRKVQIQRRTQSVQGACQENASK